MEYMYGHKCTCCKLLKQTTHGLPLPLIHTEVVEYTCNLGPDLMGELMENVSTGIDTYSIKQPLGVGGGNLYGIVGVW